MLSVGRYQLLETLGEGGMGVVYKAFDPLIERTIAVKLISARLDDSPELRQRFFAEARAAGQLSHRNIVTIFDLGEDNGHPYFAMEFLQGRNLRVRMQSPELMSLDRKLEVMTQVCDALGYAHAKGITHRDIKPANIFITDAGQVKVLDFGLARLPASELTHSKTLIGTLNYMSPEQISGERTDLRTDIFAVGVVFYELLASRSPFEANSVASLLHKILHELPEPIATVQPGISPQLGAIVDRALAKAPEERYQSLGDLLVDLAECRARLRGSDPGSAPGVVLPASGSGAGQQPPTPPPGTPIPAMPFAGTPPPGWPAWPGWAGPGTPAPGWPGTPAPANPPPGAPGSNLPFAGASPLGPAAGGSSSWPAAPGPGAARRRLIAVLALAAAVVVGAAVAAGSFTWWHRATPATQSVAVGTASRAAPSSDSPTARTDAVRTPAGSSPPTSVSPPARVQQPRDSGPDVSSIPSRHPVGTTGRERRDEARGPKAAPPSDDAPARREAEAGLDALGTAKRKAEAAGAGQLAPASYRAASEAEDSAASLMARGAFPQATGRLYEATGLFQRAESEARAEQARRAEQERLDEAARKADAASDGLGARAPQAPPAPTSQPAPLEAGPSPAALEAGVRDLLGRYVAALQSRSLASLKSIWPGLSGSQEAAIRAEFENARSVSVHLLQPDIQLSGTSSAVVTCLRQYQIETLDGHRLRSETSSRLALRRRGAEWVIENVTYDADR